MADEYINELVVNGQKRLDLTQDTATPETVLEGETFHRASGAPATGTYRPSDEIEARLEATVGHSSKNLLNLKNLSSVTRNGVTWTVDPVAGTITANGTATAESQYSDVRFTLSEGNYYFSGCPSGGGPSTYDLYAWDYTTNSRPKKWDGSTNAPSDFDGTKKQFQVVNNHEYGLTCRVKPGVTVNNLVFKLMVWDGSIADDTFEPYVTPTDELIARLDQRIYELERINEKPTADPDEGDYFITVFNDFGSDCDIWLTTPIADGGAFYDKYVYSHWVTTYHRPLDYCGKRIMVLFRAGTGDIVMTLNSSQSGQGRFYKQFDVDTFLDMCDVKDGSATNYISIHLCDDGGIRSQAEYEAYIGG